MGLFSTVISSYQSAHDLSSGYFQTKGLTNLLDQYWLSPSGELFRLSYPYSMNPDGAIRRGRVEPFDLDGEIIVTSIDSPSKATQQWTFTAGRLSDLLVIDRVADLLLDKRLARC